MTQNRIERIERNQKSLQKPETYLNNKGKMIFHQQFSICLQNLTINKIKKQKEQKKQHNQKNKKDSLQQLKHKDLNDVLNLQNLDQMLHLYDLYGNQWSKIAKQLNIKQSRKLKEFYYALFRKSIKNLTMHLKNYKDEFNYSRSITLNIIAKLSALSQNGLTNYFFQSRKKQQVCVEQILKVKLMWLQYLKNGQQWKKNEINDLVRGLLLIQRLCKRRKIKNITMKPFENLGKKYKKRILRQNSNPIITRRLASRLKKLGDQNKKQQKKQIQNYDQRQDSINHNNIKLQQNYKISNSKTPQVKIEQPDLILNMPIVNSYNLCKNQQLQIHQIPKPLQFEYYNQLALQQLNINLMFSYLNQINQINQFYNSFRF